MKKQTTQILAVIAGILIIGTMFGYINWSDMLAQVTPAPETPETPGTTENPNETPEGLVIHSALGKWRIRDVISKTTTDIGDAAYVNIIKADANGFFNPLATEESTEFADTDPDIGKTAYSTGDDLVIAVTSDNDLTNGYEHYPRWFYIKDLAQGAAIKSFDIRNPISCITKTKSGSTYKFTVNEGALGETVGHVNWLEGTTPYWDFGQFELYGRVAKTHIIFQTVNKGTIGAKVDDGATWDDADDEIVANFTMTSDEEDIYLQLIGEQANLAWGLPTLGVEASGKIIQYEAVLIFATDATEIDTSKLYADGWEPITGAGIYTELAFYYAVDPIADGCIPGTGGIISLSVPVTINDGGLTASTEYEFEVWALDWQNLDNVARGSTTNYTTLPGINGFIADQGCDTTVIPLAVTTSSGAVATPQLMGHFTTNA